MLYTVWVASSPIQCNWADVQSNLAADVKLPRKSAGGISSNPSWEAEYLQSPAGIYVLTSPTPLWLAELVSNRVLGNASYRTPALAKTTGRIWLAIWRWQAQRLLAAWGRPGYLPAGCPAFSPGIKSESSFNASLDLIQAKRLLNVVPCLATRRLTDNDLLAGWQSAGENNGMLPRLLQIMVTMGWLSRIAAVGMDTKLARLHCRRCGSWQGVRMEHCGRCGALCPTCDDCAGLGRLRGCGGLYTSMVTTQPSNQNKVIAGSLQLPFTLTPAQQQAAQELVGAVREKPTSRLLVWAACGAGKTEVTFTAIRQVLSAGGRVLLLAPRRDVVADLCRRLQDVFGETCVSGLWGGATPNWQNTPVLVATTHQAMRLAPVFHLVILDECDAFPYANDRLLVDVVQKLAKQAAFVQMSATPSPMMLAAARTKMVKLVCIPARHHGWPLPVPQICLDKAFIKWPSASTGCRQPLPITLCTAIGQTQKNGIPLLLFVPRRSLVALVSKELTQAGIQRVFGAHAGTANRDELRHKLMTGDIDVAVVTSIFERGLTFPLVDVAVLFADQERVFNTAALVQMAGRVGRTAKRPAGQVWFLAASITFAMRQAKKNILILNKRAYEAGLLKSEV